MRAIFFILVILLIAGCTAPATPPVSPPTADLSLASPSAPPPSAEPSPTAPPSATPTTLPSPTLVPPTPTLLPSPTTTPVPLRFDQAGYSQFALLSQFFPFTLGARFEESYSMLRQAFSPTGDLIAIGACWGSLSNSLRCESPSSGLLFVANPFTNQLIAEIPLEGAWPGGMDFSADGRLLLYATNEHRVALWDLQANAPGMILYQQANSATNSYPAVAAAPDGSSYAAIIKDQLYVWNADGSLRFQAPAGNRHILSYDLSASRLLAPAPGATGLQVLDALSGALLRLIPTAFTDAHISPDGGSVAAAERDSGTVQAWDVDSGTRMGGFTLTHRIESVRFNPAGDLLVISGLGDLNFPDNYNYFATVADTRTWEPIGKLYSVGSYGQVRFNRDGSALAVFSDTAPAIYGPPDEALAAALESARRFQAALHMGDYAAAAALLQPDESNREYLESEGVDMTNLPSELARLCASQELACQPLLEPVMLGYDFMDIFLLARLQAPDGSALGSPRGGTLFSFYFTPADTPTLITLPFD